MKEKKTLYTNLITYPQSVRTPYCRQFLFDWNSCLLSRFSFFYRLVIVLLISLISFIAAKASESDKCTSTFNTLERQNETKSDSAYQTAHLLLNCKVASKEKIEFVDKWNYHIGYAFKQVNKLDSALIFLNKILSSTTPESSNLKIAAFKEIADIYYQKSNLQDFKKYTQLQHSLAKSENDTVQIIDALFNIGYYYKMKNKVDSAAIAYQDAKNLCLGLGDSSSYNKIQISYAGLLVMQNKPFEALRVLVHVESYFKRTTNNNLLGDTYFFQASTYGKVGRYQEAIDTYKKLIPLYAKDNRFDRLAKCYGNLGHLYQRMDNNSRALDNYLKALEYTQEFDNNVKCGLNNSIGASYLILGEYEKAIYYLEMGKDACDKLNRKLRIAEWNRIVGTYFEKRPNESKYADYDSALVHYEQAIELFEEIESYNGLVTSLTNASEVYRKKGAMNRAEKLLKRANSIVKETQDLHNELIVLSSLAVFYREKNDFKKAYFFNVSYQKLQEEEHKTVLNKQLNENLAYYDYLLAVKQDSLKNDKQIAIQKVQLANKDKIVANQAFAITTISVILVALIFLIYIILKRNKELQIARNEIGLQKEKVEFQRDELGKTLEELIITQNKLLEKERLAAIGALTQNMAHEIKNPLNLISGATKILKDKTTNSSYANSIDSEKLLTTIENGVRRIVKILDGLHKIGASDFKLKKLDLKKLVDHELGVLKNQFEHKINIKSDLNSESIVYSDCESLKIIVSNVLSNAAEAIEADGDIHLSINENSDSFKLIISDTGKGMSKETLKKVFEPFISTKSSVYGVGIGLFKAYTIAKVLGGDLEIKSELTVGTEVIITIKKKVSF